jgi:hypothetical protein
MMTGRDNRTPMGELGPYDEHRGKGEACSTCRYWAPATFVYYATCHNTKAGLGAHVPASGEGWCKEYDDTPPMRAEEKGKTG